MEPQLNGKVEACDALDADSISAGSPTYKMNITRQRVTAHRSIMLKLSKIIEILKLNSSVEFAHEASSILESISYSPPEGFAFHAERFVYLIPEILGEDVDKAETLWPDWKREMIRLWMMPTEQCFVELYFSLWIGKKVSKSAGKTSNIKPFKSKLLQNTVKGVTFHEEATKRKTTPVYGFTFEEDDSVVECWRCELVV